MARVEIYSQQIFGALGMPEIRQVLMDHANRINNRAQQIAQSENYQFSSRVEEGIRPRGRPYARVVSEDVPGEFGDSKTKRRRTLGRASEVRS